MLQDTAANRLYLQLVETALEDSIVTDDEAAILRILAATLGVQPSDTALCLSIARGTHSMKWATLNFLWVQFQRTNLH